MVRIVTEADVRARMALSNDLLGVTATIESALTAAHLRIETEYGSRLAYGVGDDTFYLDSVIHNGVRPGGMFRLELKHGFVRDAPVVVETAFSQNSLWANPAEPIANTSVTVDAERGIVYVPESYQNRYVRIQYEYGFKDDEGDLAPDWLKEAILAYVPVVFNFSNPGNNDPKQEKMNRQSGDHALAILAPYTRNIGFCLRPVY
ncbi:hypothetical protein DLP05_010 [Stenotrophomonas phage vB_SmaS_DLP_5]|uniref:Uncharacterized protein n=1 Tax=Stenotrophomonas phage vB_SmaS_DLP_5 TaxID=2044561 RepID=A0A2D2W2E9_9CAUD|nr:hypothetical protein FDJ07_gp009 [Stenotrophomonas phage vB_SmaS_DLP_5]ATS92324.1 hypothetical protein DLP05_010 [Stenotrophomonas phage vB_SmaS_DLP_5]